MFASGAGSWPFWIIWSKVDAIVPSSMLAPGEAVVYSPANEPSPMLWVGVAYSASMSRYGLTTTSE